MARLHWRSDLCRRHPRPAHSQRPPHRSRRRQPEAQALQTNCKGLTTGLQLAKNYAQQGARQPGDIISYRRATSSRNQRATSSESAPIFNYAADLHCGITKIPPPAWTLTRLRRLEHFRTPKWLRLLRPTLKGRHYSGIGGTGPAVISGGDWAGRSSFSFFSNRVSSGSGSV